MPYIIFSFSMVFYSMTLQLALYQPDIPGNTGTIIRLGACLDIGINIIEPAGFDISDRNLKRAGMDYVELAHLRRYQDWQEFTRSMAEEKRRIILFTTHSDKAYYDFSFKANDCLLFGRESAGVPEDVHNFAFERVTIPMSPKARSLNLALSVAMAAGEAKRQILLTD